MDVEFEDLEIGVNRFLLRLGIFFEGDSRAKSSEIVSAERMVRTFAGTLFAVR